MPYIVAVIASLSLMLISGAELGAELRSSGLESQCTGFPVKTANAPITVDER